MIKSLHYYICQDLLRSGGQKNKGQVDRPQTFDAAGRLTKRMLANGLESVYTYEKQGTKKLASGLVSFGGGGFAGRICLQVARPELIQKTPEGQDFDLVVRSSGTGDIANQNRSAPGIVLFPRNNERPVPCIPADAGIAELAPTRRGFIRQAAKAAPPRPLPPNPSKLHPIHHRHEPPPLHPSATPHPRPDPPSVRFQPRPSQDAACRALDDAIRENFIITK